MYRREFMESLFLASFFGLPTVGANLHTRAIYYWNLQSPPEGLSRAVEIINKLNPDFIWYAHWVVGFPMPKDLKTAEELAKNIDPSNARRFIEWCRKEFYTLEDVKKQVEAVEGRIYCPCILGYPNFNRILNFDPITFEQFSKDEIESMLLNFGKWDIKNPKTGKPFTTEETQEYFREKDMPERGAIPDFSNPKVIEYYVRKVKALKMVGVQAVWYDMFFQLPMNLAKQFGLDHPMIKNLYDGCCDIIEGAKSLGLTVGTWSLCLNFPYRRVPDVDFVNASPTVSEVRSISVNYPRWNKIVETIKEKSPNAWLLIMFDFANKDDLPLPVFSQELTPRQQCEFLMKLHDLSVKINEQGIRSCVAYPIHGPGLGANPKKLAWDKYNVYDALAPEFNTFDTIYSLLAKPTPTPKETPTIHPIISLLILATIAAIMRRKGKKI